MKYQKVIKSLKFFLLLILSQGYHIHAISSPSVPIEGEFRVSSTDFNISKPVELTLDFSLLVHFDAIGVLLTLPQGVTLLGGRVSQEFNNLKINKNKSIKYKVRIDTDKEYQILVTVKVLNLTDSAFGKDFIIILNSKGNIPPATVFIE